MTKSSLNVITCKAAVVWKVGEPVKLEEIQVDPPKSTEVRIKMLFASLCRSDVNFCKGAPGALFPRIPGHEGVGTVESVGEKVTSLKEGDIVIPLFVGECTECLYCKSGKTNLCPTHPLNLSGLMPSDGTSRISINTDGGQNQKLYHQFSCSTWSEYAVVDSNFVAKVDPRLPLPYASFLSCGFTCGLGAVWKEADVQKGSTVAVLGLGPVGLGVIEGARMHEASKIIGIDINDMKREKGEVFGMTEFVNPEKSDKSISELVKEMTGGEGVDYSFECTGVASLLNEAMEATKVGLGTTVLIGAGVEESGPINFSPLLCGRTVKGCLYGGVRPHSDLPSIIDKCIDKDVQLDELLTHEISLDEINKLFGLSKQPDCVKVLIKF